jgi:hypothetical protein
MAALGIIFASWITASVPLPVGAHIAPLVPAAAAPSVPVPASNKTFGIIRSQWDQSPWWIPVLLGDERIAPLVPAVIAANVPIGNQATLGIIQQNCRQDPTTVIYVCSVAPLLATPPQIDNPPVQSDANFNVILNQWTTPFRLLPENVQAAPLIPPATVPDNPPIPGRQIGALIRRLWNPPPYALPEAGTLAPLIPVPPGPDLPPVSSRANLNCILRQLESAAKWDRYGVQITPAHLAPLIPIPDQPPATSTATFNLVLRQLEASARWDRYAIQITPARIASAIPAPDAPPVTSYANRNLLLASWIPPYIPLPGLRISWVITYVDPNSLPPVAISAQTFTIYGSGTFAVNG